MPILSLMAKRAVLLPGIDFSRFNSLVNDLIVNHLPVAFSSEVMDIGVTNPRAPVTLRRGTFAKLQFISIVR